ncbi:MAG: hemerythrin domain-containing protein [Maritimibacter sp.]|nr:hemerythrin domain-containing protein [Maritimibacter sp.]
MTAPPNQDDRNLGLTPTDVGLLATPLDFIAEDHDRIRNMCALIEYIADRPETHPEIVAQVSSFVRSELPALIADESSDLLPLMQRRCQPEDEIARLRTRLDAEHDTAMYLLPDALETLDALEAGRDDVPEASLHLLRNFAAHLHRHLIFENAILIPLARARLTPDDLNTLRARMTERRGLTQSKDRDDAP